MNCHCENPQLRNERLEYGVCRNCGRYIPRKPLISTSLMASVIVEQMQYNSLFNRLVANHHKVKPLTQRQKIARRIIETRRRLRNVKLAANGAFEADEDY